MTAEVILAIFYRLLADYDNVIHHNSTFFGINHKAYWSVLALLLLAYTVILMVEYYLLNLCIVNSSDKSHHNMISSIVRSPSSYFDETPSGILINKLSNDLGTIDSNLFYTLTDAVEGPIAATAAIINISLINFIFLGPAVIIMAFAVCFFLYSRPAYIRCKELFLQSKNMMLHFFG